MDEFNICLYSVHILTVLRALISKLHLIQAHLFKLFLTALKGFLQVDFLTKMRWKLKHFQHRSQDDREDNEQQHNEIQDCLNIQMDVDSTLSEHNCMIAGRNCWVVCDQDY